MALYYSITGVQAGDLIALTVTHSHASTTAIASFEVKTLRHSIGDHIDISLGYTTNNSQVFSGYVKSIERSVPDNTWIVNANDDLIKAIDFFIVSSNPADPLTYQNISAEDLVESILGLAGLNSVDADATSFTFGVSNAFEVNQVSSFDFCRSISELLAWTLWCDENGTIHFKNRKPFVMSDSEPQPGWSNDSDSTGYTWSDITTLTVSHGTNEADLRNRVVVYGGTGIYAEAYDSGSPYYHYKTAVLADVGLVDSQGVADDIAAYNLHLLNRISESISASVIGDPSLLPHRVVTVNSTALSISSTLYYIVSATHTLNSSGYVTNLELRK